MKVFNLMSRTNETRHLEWHETFKCKCRLNASIFNSKKRWNNDKCRSNCEELIDKGICDKGFIWDPSNCECECDKFCDIGEYLDYENCKCRKKLVDRLVGECAENIDEVKIAVKSECSSCMLYMVLFSIFLQLTLELILILFIFMGT